MKARLALIGKGRWGAKVAATLERMDDAELAAIATHDWKSLLTRDDLDGVIIATPPATHAELALAFMKEGFPVLVEKPMTLSLEEADMLATANGSLMVGHIHLFNPAYTALKSAVSSLGPVQHLTARFAHDGPRRDDYSALADIAPHPLSLMLDLCGTPTSVVAEGRSIPELATGFIDEATLTLFFENGATGRCEVSWAAPLKEAWLDVKYANGHARYDDRAEQKIVMTNKRKKTLVSYDTTSPLEAELRAFVRGEYRRSSAALGRDVVRIITDAENAITQNR